MTEHLPHKCEPRLREKKLIHLTSEQYWGLSDHDINGNIVLAPRCLPMAQTRQSHDSVCTRVYRCHLSSPRCLWRLGVSLGHYSSGPSTSLTFAVVCSCTPRSVFGIGTLIGLESTHWLGQARQTEQDNEREELGEASHPGERNGGQEDEVVKEEISMSKYLLFLWCWRRN